ncbi:TPM domain-containing protein [Hippea sp. KM1]|uniref:TPM domain-containing protein n=1 Tax=Hippea sp. KM1 TaxID=944481 RepID=UPI0006879337|nr:TPM domain-containing protein [Hippea sp. KM1]
MGLLRLPIRYWISLLAFILLVAIPSYAYDIPRPSGFVNDYASVLKPQTKKKLEGVLRQLKEKTGVEFAIVTIKKLNEGDIFDYSVELFQKWGIGQKGKDNGLLFLIDVGDRKLRINTGYGLEGILPDGLLGRIRDRYIIPYFKKGKYDEGILNGTMAIVGVIAKAYNVKITGYAKPKKAKRSISLVDIVLILALLFFVSPYLFPLFVGGVFGGYRSDWDSGMGSGFGGGLGGGFGGFGGGSTGGGGVGGSW